MFKRSQNFSTLKKYLGGLGAREEYSRELERIDFHVHGDLEISWTKFGCQKCFLRSQREKLDIRSNDYIVDGLERYAT